MQRTNRISMEAVFDHSAETRLNKIIIKTIRREINFIYFTTTRIVIQYKLKTNPFAFTQVKGTYKFVALI